MISFIITLLETIVNFVFCTFILTKAKTVKLYDTAYSLKPLVGPVLKGNLLRILVCVLKLPVIGSFIINHLAKDNKFDDILDFAAACGLNHEPMPVPPKVLPQDALGIAFWGQTSEEFLERLYSDQTQTLLSIPDDDDDDQVVANNKSLIRKLHRLFLSKKITPLDYVNHCLKSIRDSNPQLRTFIFLENEEKILAEARESTQRFQQGKPVSIIDGIPVGVKCCIPVKGFKTTIGSSLFLTEDDKPVATDEEEAESVRRLRAAKAIIIGLNNMHELGIGGTGANNYFGAARNPHDPTRQTGGSSSGGAAALAAGIIPIALTTDGGGSGRGPHAFCGVTGFKPGYQVVPTKTALAYSVYHECPSCATVEDCRLVFEILAQQSLVVPTSHKFSGAKLPRVGIFRSHADDCSALMRQTYQKSEEKLRSLGCEIVDVAIPNLHHASIGLNVSILADIFGGLQGKRHLIGKKVDGAHQILMLMANALSASHILASQIARRWFVEVAMPKVFEGCDVILSPATGTVAPPAVSEPFGEINLDQTSNFVRYLFFANFVGCPAISVPTGLSAKDSRDSLPVAVHLMGNFGKEDVLLQVAKMVEHSNPKLLRPSASNNNKSGHGCGHNYFPEYL